MNGHLDVTVAGGEYIGDIASKKTIAWMPYCSAQPLRRREADGGGKKGWRVMTIQ